MYIGESVILIYDGTYDGFLSAVFDAYDLKLAPEDIAPSMALSVTSSHIAAVGVPVVGGLLWLIDYRIPFWMGTGLALVSLLLVQYIDRELRKGRASA